MVVTVTASRCRGGRHVTKEGEAVLRFAGWDSRLRLAADQRRQQYPHLIAASLVGLDRRVHPESGRIDGGLGRALCLRSECQPAGSDLDGRLAPALAWVPFGSQIAGFLDRVLASSSVEDRGLVPPQITTKKAAVSASDGGPPGQDRAGVLARSISKQPMSEPVELLHLHRSNQVRPRRPVDIFSFSPPTPRASYGVRSVTVGRKYVSGSQHRRAAVTALPMPAGRSAVLPCSRPILSRRRIDHRFAQRW